MSSVKIANPTVSVPSRFSLLDLLRRCASALFGNLRIHHVLFLAFTIIAAVPVFTLAWWVEHRAVQQEIDAATDKHLLVARNLTAALGPAGSFGAWPAPPAYSGAGQVQHRPAFSLCWR